jgi:hypothetical protein
MIHAEIVSRAGNAAKKFKLHFQREKKIAACIGSLSGSVSIL